MSKLILLPVFALAAWTACIMGVMAYRRIGAVRKGLHMREFAVGDGAQVPLPCVLAHRNYQNLLELPLLFYVACIIAYAAGAVNAAVLTLAWLYVALRIVHSVIHVGYNRISHRFYAFATSNLMLLGLWVALGVALAG